MSRGRQRRSFGFLLSKDKGQKSKVEGQNSYHLACGPVDSLTCSLKTVGYHPKVRCPLSVVRSPQRTKQPSRGYQRGRANAKTSVLPATYGNLCTSVWFCKDTKTEIAIVHLCPFMSTYVHLFLLKHTIANIYKIGYLHRLATRCS